MNSNILQLDSGARMFTYEAFRSRNDRRSVDIEPVEVRIMPVDAAMKCVTDGLVRELKRRTSPRTKPLGIKHINLAKGHCLINGTCYLRRSLSWRDAKMRTEMLLDIYIPHDFPNVAPVVSLTHSGKQQWVPITWSLEDFAINALANRLAPALEQACILSRTPTEAPVKNKEMTHG